MENASIAPLFRNPRNTSKADLPLDSVPSSSPAFDTLVHPIRTNTNATTSSKPSILPILLAPATLRPLAFRILTKKHGLTLTSSALQLFATWIGKHCGLGWREDGLAEKVLNEAAKLWKNNGGSVIVEGDGDELKEILHNIEVSMNGGTVSHQSGLKGQALLALDGQEVDREAAAPHGKRSSLARQDSLGLSALMVDDPQTTDTKRDPREWLKVVGAFDHPRLTYNTIQKHFEPIPSPPSLLPNPSHKLQLFRHRYNLTHQRLLRNESFQSSAVVRARTSLSRISSSVAANAQQVHKLTSIANLQGRPGSGHVLLGLLTISPTGLLTLTDLTGSIVLEMQHARPVPEDGTWFTPGMITLVDGMYEGEGSTVESGLDGKVGVGGMLGGRFVVFSVSSPPCERREVTLGISNTSTGGKLSGGGGFGWVDFLGVGSERASGSAMRKVERNIFNQVAPEEEASGRGRMIILGEVNLDSTKNLQALRKVLSVYATEPAEQTPMVVVLMGNFAHHAAMSGSIQNGSVEYKEYFDSLAAALSEYPTMLQNTSFVFVPGNNDPWASSFSAGSSTPIPQGRVPDLFTLRVKRAFATANLEAERTTGKNTNGEAVWTTNPARISLFGPAQEIVMFRDDMLGRLRRNAIRFRPLANDATAGPSDRANKVGCNDVINAIPLDGGASTGLPDAGEQNVEGNSTMEMAESYDQETKHKPEYEISAELQTARKLIKTVLDQGYLSPFPLSIRPVLWDFAGVLHLYPLPTALVLMDPEAPPFVVSYQSCLVMNPGPLTTPKDRNLARWMEYNASTKQGIAREARF